MGTKICTKCNTEKKLSLFGVHRQAPDGHMAECKKCHNERGHIKYYMNIEESRANSRERAKKSYHRHEIRRRKSAYEWARKNPEKVKKTKRNYCKRNPEKVKEWKRQDRIRRKEKIFAFS